jgi:hypothetical protein
MDVSGFQHKEKKESNLHTQANLAMAFTTTKAMMHFPKAANLNWPDGLACNVVQSLHTKYQLNDAI